MDVGANQVFIGQIEAPGADGAGHHVRRPLEEVLVVGAAGGAIGVDQRRLAAATGPAAALGVVGRRGGDVAHVDRVQLGNVDAQFHRGRAEQQRQDGLAKLLLALFADFTGHLRGVLSGFDALQVEGD